MYLALSFGIVAIFVSVLAFRRPRGPQPATYGHLSSLINLIDVWPMDSKRMYWGHKPFVEVVPGYLHAGEPPLHRSRAGSVMLPSIQARARRLCRQSHRVRACMPDFFVARFGFLRSLGGRGRMVLLYSIGR